MLASLASLLLAAPFAAPLSAYVGEVQRAIGPFEASAEATGPRSVPAFAREGTAALPAVGALAAREGWKLHELRPETGRLDEVFRSITTDGAPGAVDA